MWPSFRWAGRLRTAVARPLSARSATFATRFLPEDYSLSEAWTRALNSSLCVRVHPDELYMRAGKSTLRPNVVDLDLLATSAARTGTHLSELRDLLHKFRKSASAADLPPSSHYSVTRAFSDHGETDQLLEVLDDRLNYGVFLCAHSASLLLDRLIAEGDFASASKVASMMALQENFESPIARQLSLYAAYKYLTSINLPFVSPPLPPPEKPKKKPEEKKIRVQFLRNPFFDDHFDLTDPKLLAGKTLATVGRERNDPIDFNALTLGFTVYEKYDRAARAASEAVSEGHVYQDSITLLEKILQNNSDGTQKDKLERVEQILSVLKSAPQKLTNIEGAIENGIKRAVESDSTREMERQKKLFDEWETARMEKLKEQIETIENEKRAAAIEKREKELKQLEQEIWLMDNRDKVDLIINNKNLMFRKAWTGKKTKPKPVANEYVPPEV